MNVLKIYAMDFGTIVNNSIDIKLFSLNDINSLNDYLKSQCRVTNKIKVSVVDTDALNIDGSVKTAVIRNLTLIKDCINLKVRVKKVGINEIEDFIDKLPDNLKRHLISTEVA